MSSAAWVLAILIICITVDSMWANWCMSRNKDSDNVSEDSE